MNVSDWKALSAFMAGITVTVIGSLAFAEFKATPLGCDFAKKLHIDKECLASKLSAHKSDGAQVIIARSGSVPVEQARENITVSSNKTAGQSKQASSRETKQEPLKVASAKLEESLEESLSLVQLIAKADVDAGKREFKKCGSCHSISEGGKRKVGPNLWALVGASMASVEGFKYSKALKSKGEKWTYENLDLFFKNPKKFVPKTRMSFRGIKGQEARAALIAYMRTKASTPLPLE